MKELENKKMTAKSLLNEIVVPFVKAFKLNNHTRVI